MVQFVIEPPVARFRAVPAMAMALALALLLPSQAHATWSVLAVDEDTGEVVVASATCVPQERLRTFPSEGLMDIQAIVVPGVGVAAAQAGVDRSRENQYLVHRELRAGTHPEEILERLREDPEIERRQFAILDLQGRWAGFSGEENGEVAEHSYGHIPGTGIHFSVQGNILDNERVVYEGVKAFMAAEGTLADRVMAAMEGADEAGGDGRCSCETEPVPDASCNGRTSHVAYLLVADPNDEPGESFNDGDWSLFLDVHDENIEPHENANPVITLRMRYNEWLAEHGR